jgi:hypothetical protein
MLAPGCVEMLAHLVGWYAGQEQNRRRYPRVRKDYQAMYSVNAGKTWLPLRGVDLGGGGMCAISEHAIDAIVVDAVLQLGRDVPLRAHPVWGSEVREGGKTVHCYGFQFVSVEAANWEAVMEWVTGKPFDDSGQMPAVRIADTEVARFLPSDLRKRLLDELTARSRLDSANAAMVHFDYGGVTAHNGHPMHRFTVHSKVKVMGSEMRHTTRFLCDDEGREIVVLN